MDAPSKERYDDSVLRPVDGLDRRNGDRSDLN
jgi:hypothetical protein